MILQKKIDCQRCPKKANLTSFDVKGKHEFRYVCECGLVFETDETKQAEILLLDDKYKAKGSPQDEVELQRGIAGKCKYGIVEIGVLFGETAQLFCKANPKLPMIVGIDPLIPDSMNINLVGMEEKIKLNTGGFPNFHFIKDYSFNVVEYFFAPFDYLFIDGSHFYHDVERDFNDWFPKLKKGGYLGLHDSAKFRGGAEHWGDPSMIADELIFDERVKHYKTVHALTVFQKR